MTIPLKASAVRIIMGQGRLSMRTDGAYFRLQPLKLVPKVDPGQFAHLAPDGRWQLMRMRTWLGETQPLPRPESWQ